MKRQLLFNYIEDRLNHLATRINSRGRLNILDLHNHSETFYQLFLNEIFGWNLVNMNRIKINVEAIDLIDDKNKLIVQVSATSTKQKVETALAKKNISNYKSYTFKFISISKDSDDLMSLTFRNPHEIKFKPDDDIIDKNSILKLIVGLDYNHLQKLYDFIKGELGNEIDFIKLESNLSSIINLLSKEDFDNKPVLEINAYEIDRKIKYNNLNSAEAIINEFSIHYGRLSKIYNEFDTLGHNKSSSVLNAITKEYLKIKDKLTNDDLFFDTVEKVIDRVLNSTNYKAIPYEELELCVNILVVDAFIRCKIFSNPSNYNYVAAR